VNGVSVGLRVLKDFLSIGDHAIHVKLFLLPFMRNMQPVRAVSNRTKRACVYAHAGVCAHECECLHVCACECIGLDFSLLAIHCRRSVLCSVAYTRSLCPNHLVDTRWDQDSLESNNRATNTYRSCTYTTCKMHKVPMEQAWVFVVTLGSPPIMRFTVVHMWFTSTSMLCLVAMHSIFS